MDPPVAPLSRAGPPSLRSPLAARMGRPHVGGAGTGRAANIGPPHRHTLRLTDAGRANSAFPVASRGVPNAAVGPVLQHAARRSLMSPTRLRRDGRCYTMGRLASRLPSAVCAGSSVIAGGEIGDGMARDGRIRDAGMRTGGDGDPDDFLSGRTGHPHRGRGGPGSGHARLPSRPARSAHPVPGAAERPTRAASRSGYEERTNASDFAAFGSASGLACRPLCLKCFRLCLVVNLSVIAFVSPCRCRCGLVSLKRSLG